MKKHLPRPHITCKDCTPDSVLSFYMIKMLWYRFASSQTEQICRFFRTFLLHIFGIRTKKTILLIFNNCWGNTNFPCQDKSNATFTPTQFSHTLFPDHLWIQYFPEKVEIWSPATCTVLMYWLLKYSEHTRSKVHLFHKCHSKQCKEDWTSNNYPVCTFVQYTTRHPPCTHIYKSVGYVNSIQHSLPTPTFIGRKTILWSGLPLYKKFPDCDTWNCKPHIKQMHIY